MPQLKGTEGIYRKIELITRRWWFLLIFIVMGTIIPSYASRGFSPEETGKVIETILTQAIIFSLSSEVYIAFKIAPIILISLIIFVKNKVARLFSIYVAITYILFAILQSIAITEEYGFAVLTENLLMFMIVSILWSWESTIHRNDFTSVKRAPWRYWVVPLAFLAFWYPVNPQTLMPDFNPIYIFTNEAGLTFCMMTPVYLAVLTLYWPRVNIATLRVTSLAGILIAFWNIIVNFFTALDILWWNGILHLPLLFISTYAFILSFRSIQKEGDKI